MLYYFQFIFINFLGAQRLLHSFPTRRSSDLRAPERAYVGEWVCHRDVERGRQEPSRGARAHLDPPQRRTERNGHRRSRSEEHTSELQSRENLVCRLLLEKKKKKRSKNNSRSV